MQSRALCAVLAGAFIAVPAGFGAINVAQAAEDVLEEVVVTV